MTSKRPRYPGSGFSFIELLASLAILSLLAAVAMPLAQTTVRRNREHDLQRALRDIRQAIDAYKMANDDGRISHSVDASGYPPELSDLVKGVPDAHFPDRRKLYFLRRLPRDPFFEDNTVPADKTWGLRSFQSSAEEPEPGRDVFDIYSKSDKTGLNGVAYREW